MSLTIPAGQSYFRITSSNYYTTNKPDWAKVVDGEGARLSSKGSRYAYPNVESVYLGEDMETCFAEAMFYFHREILESLDDDSVHPKLPFQRDYVLWDVVFKSDIPKVYDLVDLPSRATFAVIPSIMMNPYMDYHHLKQRRADIQTAKFNGLRAPSSRSQNKGNLLVMFRGQQTNVKKITPYVVKFQLLDTNGNPFINHNHDLLDFKAGYVKFADGCPVGGDRYKRWNKIGFNH